MQGKTLQRGKCEKCARFSSGMLPSDTVCRTIMHLSKDVEELENLITGIKSKKGKKKRKDASLTWTSSAEDLYGKYGE